MHLFTFRVVHASHATFNGVLTDYHAASCCATNFATSGYRTLKLLPISQLLLLVIATILYSHNIDSMHAKTLLKPLLLPSDLLILFLQRGELFKSFALLRETSTLFFLLFELVQF